VLFNDMLIYADSLAGKLVYRRRIDVKSVSDVENDSGKKLMHAIHVMIAGAPFIVVDSSRHMSVVVCRWWVNPSHSI
jgi:hypothetical protein